MDVVIELKSRVESDDAQVTSLNLLGTMIWEETTCHLSCEIVDDDGDAVQTLVTADGDFAVVEQTGSRASRLQIRQGERSVSSYETPYGSLQVGVTGLRVDNALTPEGGTLSLCYEVDINAASVSTNTIDIRVRRTSLDDESSRRDGQ